MNVKTMIELEKSPLGNHHNNDWLIQPKNILNLVSKVDEEQNVCIDST